MITPHDCEAERRQERVRYLRRDIRAMVVTMVIVWALAADGIWSWGGLVRGEYLGLATAGVLFIPTILTTVLHRQYLKSKVELDLLTGIPPIAITWRKR